MGHYLRIHFFEVLRSASKYKNQYGASSEHAICRPLESPCLTKAIGTDVWLCIETQKSVLEIVLSNLISCDWTGKYLNVSGRKELPLAKGRNLLLLPYPINPFGRFLTFLPRRSFISYKLCNLWVIIIIPMNVDDVASSPIPPDTSRATIVVQTATRNLNVKHLLEYWDGSG